MEKIGRYELLREIGHGGMGKVYLARDSSEMGRKMQREVAIKVMLERQTDSSMRERFFREAQAAGNLSHPNIVTIHDLAIDDDTPYIVMEYLEGVSLAEWLFHDRLYDLVDRLSALCGEGTSEGSSAATVLMPTPGESEHLASALEGLANDLPGLRPDVDAGLGQFQEPRSPIQPRTALDLLQRARDVLWPVATRPEQDRAMTIAERLTVGKQIADGLAFAHRKGVVHRDIKPGNIQLVNGFHLEDGFHVKILDFGIAQLESQQSRTRGAPPGTPRYMSPEQYQGDREELNHRTDIWSLGVMLYEILAGRHAFEGDTFAALSYRIVHEPHVPLSTVNPAVPESVSEVVSRALAKQPADRFQAATALSRALRVCIDELAQTVDRPEDEIRRDIEKYITFARNLVRQGKFDQAEREARRAQALEESEYAPGSRPDTPSRAGEVITEIGAARERAARERQGLALVGEAREQLARGQGSSARDLIAKAARQAPDSTSVQAACTELGERLARLERAQAVAVELRAAREALEQRRVDVAEAHVRAALDLHPAHEDAMELAAAIRRARELDARVAAARRSADDGDLEAAEHTLTAVLDGDPDHPVASTLLETVRDAARAVRRFEAARTAFEAGRFGEAEGELLESLALDDSHEPTLTLLAEVRTAIERTERERVVAARVAAAQKALDDGDLGQAELDLELAFAVDEAHEGALALQARVQEGLRLERVHEDARRRDEAEQRSGEEARTREAVRQQAKADEARRRSAVEEEARRSREREDQRQREQTIALDVTYVPPAGTDGQQEDGADAGAGPAPVGLLERVAARPRQHWLLAGAAGVALLALVVWFVGPWRVPAADDGSGSDVIVALPSGVAPPTANPDDTVTIDPDVPPPEPASGTLPTADPVGAGASDTVRSDPVGAGASDTVPSDPAGGNDTVPSDPATPTAAAAGFVAPGAGALDPVGVGIASIDVAPWAEIREIRNVVTGALVEPEIRVTPCRLSLPAGRYEMRFVNPYFESSGVTLTVTIEADQTTDVRATLPDVDYDSLLADFS